MCIGVQGQKTGGVGMSGGTWRMVGVAVKTVSLVWKLEALVALLRIYQIQFSEYKWPRGP